MQTEPVGRRYATAFALIVFFLFGFLFFYFYQRYEQDAYLPNRDATATADGLALKASADGHFRTSGTINGEPVVFMLDTGATVGRDGTRFGAGQHRQRRHPSATGAAGRTRLRRLDI